MACPSTTPEPKSRPRRVVLEATAGLLTGSVLGGCVVSGLRALLTSGYVAAGGAPRVAELALLPKPCAPADLARVVREALGDD